MLQRVRLVGLVLPIKKKIYKRVKVWNKLYEENKIDFKKASISLNSWIGHAKNADSYLLIQNIKKNVNGYTMTEKERIINNMFIKI